MHELSILIEALRIVEETAKQQNIDSVKGVVLQVGELSSVVPKFLEDYFPIVIENKPIFNDAVLKIEMLPGIARCQKCHTTFNVVENKGYCPNCNSYDKDLVSGDEFFIKEILVPDSESAQ